MARRDDMGPVTVPRRVRRQRTRVRRHRVSLAAALAVGGAGAALHAPPALFLGTAWLAGAGIMPLFGIHRDGMQVCFGVLTGAAATFLYSLLVRP